MYSVYFNRPNTLSPPKKHTATKKEQQPTQIPVVIGKGIVAPTLKLTLPVKRALELPAAPPIPAKRLFVEPVSVASVATQTDEPLRIDVLEMKPPQDEQHREPLFPPSQPLSPCSADKVCIVLALGVRLA